MPALAHLNHLVACHPCPKIIPVGELVTGKQALVLVGASNSLTPQITASVASLSLASVLTCAKFALPTYTLPTWLGTDAEKDNECMLLEGIVWGYHLMLAEVCHLDLDFVARSCSNYTSFDGGVNSHIEASEVHAPLQCALERHLGCKQCWTFNVIPT